MTVVLTRLVGLFPAPFRLQFGRDMTEQIERDLAAARADGQAAAFWFAFTTAIDLIRSAVAERRRPTLTDPRLPSPSPQDRDSMISTWLNDLRHAVAALRRAPGFAAATIITLALAIGANVAIFSVVDAVLLDPLPFEHADRLVVIQASAPGTDFPDEFGVSAEFYVHYKERARLLEDVAAFNSFTNTLQVGDRIERVRMAWPTWSLFQTVGATPIMGRLPRPEDGETVTVISHELWTTWFGSDPDVVGKTVMVSGEHRTIVGVMGADFWFPREDVLLWLSYELTAGDIENTGRFGMVLVGRMAPDADADALRTELTSLASELPERFGGSSRYEALMQQHQAVVEPVRAVLLGDVSGPLLILLGAVSIVLLIACANVANLFTVRAEHRQRDLAVRRALGAGRGALVRTQLSEAIAIAGAAGALAVALAWAGVPSFLRAAPQGVPRMADAGLSPSTLLFTLGATAFAAIACGLIPALRASAPRLTRLQESGRGSTRTRHWGRDAMVVAQTALALVLLIGAGLLLRSFWELRNVDPGYDTEDLLTVQIAPDEDHLVDAASFARFHLDFAERIAAMPGVESVGLVENVPLDEGLRGSGFYVEGRANGPDDAIQLDFTYAAGDYFGTMGIEVLRGRPFQPADQTTNLGNVVISKTAADLLWAGEDPVGRRLRIGSEGPWETVVGVVDDILQYGFRDEPAPVVYFPFVGQDPETRQGRSSPG